MVGLRSNDFIKDHVKELAKYVSGITDHSVIYKSNNVQESNFEEAKEHVIIEKETPLKA